MPLQMKYLRSPNRHRKDIEHAAHKTTVWKKKTKEEKKKSESAAAPLQACSRPCHV